MTMRAKLVLLLVTLLVVAMGLVFGVSGCGSGCKPNGNTCALNEQCCSRNCSRETMGTCICAPLGGRCSSTPDCCQGGQCSNGTCVYRL